MLEVECGGDVTFDGEDSIQRYASSKRAERGFCKTCGTHLYVKSLPAEEYGIPPGLLGKCEGIQFSRQVFIDHKPHYYSFADPTQDIPSAYIYEHFPETRDDR